MNPDDFAEYLADVAWFWPGIAISVAIGVIVGPRLARALGVRRAVATTLILGLGLIVSATLTPSLGALTSGTVGSGSCDLGRIGPATPMELLRFGDPTFNVLLFVPLGAAIGQVLGSRLGAGLVAAGVALPFAIETVQLLAIDLDRACQSADVSDNLTGLVIGLVLGLLVRPRADPPTIGRGPHRSSEGGS